MKKLLVGLICWAIAIPCWAILIAIGLYATFILLPYLPIILIVVLACGGGEK